MTTKIQKKNAFAKLNLILFVLNKRADGYHNIFSLFHKIDLCDIITIEPSDKMQVFCDMDLGINWQNNIAYKAVAAINQHLNTNFTAKITIQKNIPFGAGLGGGSSDAATTLLMLNELWQLKLSQKTMLSIAESLGADVPFFLKNSPQWVYEKGETMQKLNLKAKKNIEKFYLIVYPNIQINTGLAYQKLNRNEFELDINDFAANKIADYSKKMDDNLELFLPKFMQNDFEKSVFDMHPAIKKIHQKLSISSGGLARLTGSGSSVFALYNSKDEAEKAKQNFLENSNNMNCKLFTGKLIE